MGQRVSEERAASGLRAMLEMLDQIESLMDDHDYTETGERLINQLRVHWTAELAGLERGLIKRWPVK